MRELKVASIKASEHNARKHSEAQIEQIAKSLDEFGWVGSPIIINEQNEILAGEGRWKAAQLLGWEKIPVERVKHLSDTQQRQFMLADNRIAMNAEWDFDILGSELTQLVQEDMSLIELGFTQAELASILGDDDPGTLGGKEGAEGEDDGSTGGLGNPVISYTLVFDDEDQQARFFAFVRALKQNYEGDTLAERLDKCIADWPITDE